MANATSRGSQPFLGYYLPVNILCETESQRALCGEKHVHGKVVIERLRQPTLKKKSVFHTSFGNPGSRGAGEDHILEILSHS